MKIKAIRYEDFSNYKRPSMLIGFPKCTWKCEKECGKQVCQNGILANSPDIDITVKEIVSLYLDNKLTSALVFGGLEPFDSWDDLISLVSEFRKYTNDTIVIYTGYYKEEIEDKINILREYNNIIIKFGRFIPNRESRYNSVLGVTLASDNQYVERIS